ncbi:MAG: ribonuclease Z, partial [Lutimonas sp.]
IEMQLRLTKSWVDFPLHFHELSSEKSELIFEDKQVSVYTIPLNHRIYTNGFLFKEKRKDRKLALEKIKMYPDIEICDYHKIKKGFDFVRENGEIISNDLLTESPKEPLSYAFCSDTSFHEPAVPIIKKADLLYHEATFLEDNKELAEKTKHSTAREAATIAKKAAVRLLILGHFSSRYKDEHRFLDEATEIFTPVELAETGKVFSLNN